MRTMANKKKHYLTSEGTWVHLGPFRTLVRVAPTWISQRSRVNSKVGFEVKAVLVELLYPIGLILIVNMVETSLTNVAVCHNRVSGLLEGLHVVRHVFLRDVLEHLARPRNVVHTAWLVRFSRKVDLDHVARHQGRHHGSFTALEAQDMAVLGSRLVQEVVC